MKRILFAFALLFSISSFAGNCPQLYPTEHEIDVPGTIELCNSFYVVRYNDTTHAVLFSAEVLQPAGHQAERLNNFHADTRTQSKISPKRYVRTGFDKGHMTPAGDATNADQMSETFLMSNMTPQRPTLNRISWRVLEEYTRKTATSVGHPIHVITIAVYSPSPEMMNGIPIPVGYYKVIYGTSIQTFYAPNIDNGKASPANLPDAEKYLGVQIH